MHFAVLAPYFTKEENNAIVEEVHAAEAAETSQLYERLVELMDEWREIVQELNSVYRKRTACRKHLCGARAQNNKYLDGYNEPRLGISVPSCLDLFKTGTPARKEVEQLRKSARFYSAK